MTQDWSDETPNSGGQKIVFIFRDPDDPSLPRELNQVRDTATKDGAHLFVALCPDQDAFNNALRMCQKFSIVGIALVAPQRSDGQTIENCLGNSGIKILAVDGIIKKAQSGAPNPYILSDYPAAGSEAGKKMIFAANKLKWKLEDTGAIIFTSNLQTSLSDATDAEASQLMKAGLRPGNVFICPLTESNAFVARESAAATMGHASQAVQHWLIGGANDLWVAGGLRATEDVHVGTSNVAGVGIGGDGAIYDLQRPRGSGLVGSVLLPKDRIAREAEHTLYRWVKDGVAPASKGDFEGIFMTRDNVRQIKASNHLTE